MTRKLRPLTSLLIYSCLMMATSAALAQDDPFAPSDDGEAPIASEPEVAPPADDEATSPKPAKPTKPTTGPTEEDVAAAKKALEDRRQKAIERERLQPVLDAIAETRPSSPVELIGAINSLIDLNQPDEAKKYITKLLALKLNEEAMYVLQRRVGSGVFFKLSGDDRYHPDGKELADKVLIAGHKQSRDRKRLAKLIKELNDPAFEVRSGAISDLKSGGIDAVLLMIATLADEKRAAEHPRIRYALTQMGSIVVEPLIGTLASPDPNLKAQAIEILGYLEARRPTPYLIHPLLSKKQPHAVRVAAKEALNRIARAIPSEQGGQAYLYNRIHELTSGDLPRAADAAGNIELWLWDAARKQPVPMVYVASDAALVEAAQLAADLYDLQPESPEYRRMYLLAILESAKLINGLDRSLPTGKGSRASWQARQAWTPLRICSSKRCGRIASRRRSAPSKCLATSATNDCCCRIAATFARWSKRSRIRIAACVMQPLRRLSRSIRTTISLVPVTCPKRLDISPVPRACDVCSSATRNPRPRSRSLVCFPKWVSKPTRPRAVGSSFSERPKRPTTNCCF